jgi:hypothetical protein
MKEEVEEEVSRSLALMVAHNPVMNPGRAFHSF